MQFVVVHGLALLSECAAAYTNANFSNKYEIIYVLGCWTFYGLPGDIDNIHGGILFTPQIKKNILPVYNVYSAIQTAIRLIRQVNKYRWR